MTHPREQVLALLAGGEVGRIRRMLLDRHVRDCAVCRDKIAEYRELRAEAAEIDLPGEVNWNFLAADMRANIRLGLEAGACVRATQDGQRWQGLRRWTTRPVIVAGIRPSPAVAMCWLASVLILGIAGELLRENVLHRPAAESAPVLETTDSGVELRTGDNSLMLLNRHGDAANQTVSARGDISQRYIDETGAVTINNVSLQ